MKQNEIRITKEIVEAAIKDLHSKIDVLATKRINIKNELPKLEKLRRENEYPVGSPLRDTVDAQYERKLQRYLLIPGQIARYSDRIQTLKIILTTF